MLIVLLHVDYRAVRLVIYLCYSSRYSSRYVSMLIVSLFYSHTTVTPFSSSNTRRSALISSSSIFTFGGARFNFRYSKHIRPLFGAKGIAVLPLSPFFANFSVKILPGIKNTNLRLRARCRWTHERQPVLAVSLFAPLLP